MLPHEFLNYHGEPQHLSSSPHKAQPTLNRESVAHLAAHARAVLDFGYPAERVNEQLHTGYPGRDLGGQRNEHPQLKVGLWMAGEPSAAPE